MGITQWLEPIRDLELCWGRVWTLTSLCIGMYACIFQVNDIISTTFIIFFFRCLDHRIDLLFKVPMKMFPEFFGALKKGINFLSSYYTKSWKKTAHFGEFCDKKGYKRFKMRPTHDVRWVHSYHQVILLILVHLLPLLQHLMDIKFLINNWK